MLSDAEVLQQLPGRVGKTGRHLPAKLRGKPADNFVEARMRIFPVEQACDGAPDIAAGRATGHVSRASSGSARVADLGAQVDHPEGRGLDDTASAPLRVTDRYTADPTDCSIPGREQAADLLWYRSSPAAGWSLPLPRQARYRVGVIRGHRSADGVIGVGIEPGRQNGPGAEPPEMIGDARQSIAFQGLVSEAVVRVGVRRAQCERRDRRHCQADLGAIVVGFAGITEVRSPTDFQLLHDRVGDTSQEKGHGIADSRGRLTPCADLVVDRPLRSQLRIKPSRSIRLIDQLCRGWRLERRGDVTYGMKRSLAVQLAPIFPLSADIVRVPLSSNPSPV